MPRRPISQVTLIVTMLLLSACAAPKTVNDSDRYSSWCDYKADHDIGWRLLCLRVSLAQQ